jgi:hypothetical protein
MQHSPEVLQQEIKALEERLQQARRALQALHGGIGQDDDELELIELSESDIVAEPEDDQLVERVQPPLRPIVDPWAGVAANVSEPTAAHVSEVASVEDAWPTAAPVNRDPLMTGTLAELYVSQGFTDKATDIYRDILATEPGNATAASRMAELESQLLAAGSEVLPAGEQSSAMAAVPQQGAADAGSVLPVLEGWLENIRRLRECR